MEGFQMHNLKKILALLLAAVMLCACAACGAANSASSAASEAVASSAEASAAADGTGSSYHVGVVQLVQHEALDAATQGFQDALKDKLGDSVTFDVQNASGDSANCATIVNGFLSSGVDLIMANATPALQAASAATADVPILGTSVTDYATALEISDWNGTVGTNVSGTSDLAPLADQAAMILYCSAEPNSLYQCDAMEGYLTAEGYEVTRFTFTDTNDVTSVTTTACENSEVIYIPTDNTAANNTEAIANVVLPAGVPVVAGEEGICAGCGVATLSISYYDLGYATGEMAAQILAEGADVSAMPVAYAANVTKEYNADNADLLNVTIPEGYVAIGG